MAKVTKASHSRAKVKQAFSEGAKLGRLADLKLKPSTIVRYCNAILCVLSWVTDMGHGWPEEKLEWIDV